MSSSPIAGVTPQNDVLLPVNTNIAAQVDDEYRGVIPMNMSVFVGDTGNSRKNSLNTLAAVPLTLRTNGTHTTSGLLLPDNVEGIETPLEEWLELTPDGVNEVVYIGDIENDDHLAVSLGQNIGYSIRSEYPEEIASSIAQEFFLGSESVVLAYSDLSPAFGNIITVHDQQNSINPMTSSSVAGSTIDGNDWEWMAPYTPSGGGAICTLDARYEDIWFDLLAEEDGEYFSMDYPYLDGLTVRYPYEARPESTWNFHVIDLHDTARSVTFTIDIQTPQAVFYDLVVEEGEDCVFNFDVDLRGANRSVGLNVLDPNGNIILDANRYALFPEFGKVTSISASLAHPDPGVYRAYVYSSESTLVNYEIRITKKELTDNWISMGASASNGASLASALGSPLLYTSSHSLSDATLQALYALDPKTVYVVDPLQSISGNVISELEELGIYVSRLDSFNDIQGTLAFLHNRESNEGSVILYDPIGARWAPVGLSAASKGAVAIPFSYADSGLMTLSQIPEQIGYHREYTLPFIASFSIIGLWRSSGHLSAFSPPYGSMKAICDRFFLWLEELTGILDVSSVITIAPFRGPGVTLPTAFERSILGATVAGRYPSVSPIASFVQIMRSILRIPLQSSPSREKTALGTHLAYSYYDTVSANNLFDTIVDNSNEFQNLMIASGLNPMQQAGPSTITVLDGSPYYWVASVHGATGDSLYDDDGLVALMGNEAWRGYDSGGNSGYPDPDADGMANPTEDMLEIYNMSDVVPEVDLNGMIAILDACQLGSSYAPASLMEAGAESVVAAWADVLIGPSDMVEMNIELGMIIQNLTLGRALNEALDENSHLYSLDRRGTDTHTTSTEIHMVSASALQFVVFGDPGVKISDHRAIPHQFENRLTSGHVDTSIRATPGSSYLLPMGIHDPVQHIFAQEGTYSVSTYSPFGILINEYSIACDGTELAYCEISFSATTPPGIFLAVWENEDASIGGNVSILLGWIPMEIDAIEVRNALQIGMWDLGVSIISPFDVSVDAILQVLVANTPILVMSNTIMPGRFSIDVSVEVLFMSAGEQSIVAILEIPESGQDIAVLASSVDIGLHWAYYGLFIGVPGLAVGVIGAGLFTKRKLSGITKLRDAYSTELDGDIDAAFDFYCENDLPNAATRVAVNEGLLEARLTRLSYVFGGKVKMSFNELAASYVIDGDHLTASRLYAAADNNEQALMNQVIGHADSGMIENSVVPYRELVLKGFNNSGLEILDWLLTKNDVSLTNDFCRLNHDAIVQLSGRITQSQVTNDTFIAIASTNDDPRLWMNLALQLGKNQDVIDKISSAPNVAEKAHLTELLDSQHKVPIAKAVVGELTNEGSFTKIHDYLAPLDLGDHGISVVIAPLLGLYPQNPKKRGLKTSLKRISKLGSTGSLSAIENAIEMTEQISQIKVEQKSTTKASDPTGALSILPSINDMALMTEVLNSSRENFLSGRDPSLLKIGELAEFVAAMRKGSAEMSPALKDKVKDSIRIVEEALFTKITSDAKKILTFCELDLSPEGLGSTSKQFADLLVQQVNRTDPLSTVHALILAMREKDFMELNDWVTNNIGNDVLENLVLQVMRNPVQRAPYVQRHTKPVVGNDGKMVLKHDIEAVRVDILKDASYSQQSRANEVWVLGLSTAIVRLILDAFALSIPQSDKDRMAINYLKVSGKITLLQNDVLRLISDLIRIGYYSQITIAELLSQADVPHRVRSKLRQLKQ
jgi:hypothetical protein